MISGGKRHVMLINDDGYLLGLGDNYNGQLGIKNTGRTYETTNPMRVPLRNITSVSCGEHFTVGANMNGNVFAFGINKNGELGIHGLFDRTKPIKLPIPNVAQVFAGYNHTICLSTSNNVCGFGINTFGQLGIGNTADKCEPTRINTLHNIKTVSCGRNYSLFLDFDGCCYGCGSNNKGQLGIDAGMAIIPQKLDVPLPIESISTGESHSFLVTIEKTVYGMGNNSNGQLGLGRSVDTTCAITEIPDLSEIRMMLCGETHSLAIRCDGSLLGSGCDAKGKLSRIGRRYSFTVIDSIKNVIYGVTFRDCNLLYNDEGVWYTGQATFKNKGHIRPYLFPPSENCFPSVNTSLHKTKSARK